MMLHAKQRWPKAITANLWPRAMRMANEVSNVAPGITDAMSPIEKSSQAAPAPKVKHCHTFGSPVHASDAKPQSGKTVSKWKHEARIGICLGASPTHSRKAALVLSLTAGHVWWLFASFGNFLRWGLNNPNPNFLSLSWTRMMTFCFFWPNFLSLSWTRMMTFCFFWQLLTLGFEQLRCNLLVTTATLSQTLPFPLLNAHGDFLLLLATSYVGVWTAPFLLSIASLLTLGFEQLRCNLLVTTATLSQTLPFPLLNVHDDFLLLLATSYVIEMPCRESGMTFLWNCFSYFAFLEQPSRVLSGPRPSNRLMSRLKHVAGEGIGNKR
jgi:hypothetical protein